MEAASTIVTTAASPTVVMVMTASQDAVAEALAREKEKERVANIPTSPLAREKAKEARRATSTWTNTTAREKAIVATASPIATMTANPTEATMMAANPTDVTVMTASQDPAREKVKVARRVAIATSRLAREKEKVANIPISPLAREKVKVARRVATATNRLVREKARAATASPVATMIASPTEATATTASQGEVAGTPARAKARVANKTALATSPLAREKARVAGVAGIERVQATITNTSTHMAVRARVKVVAGAIVKIPAVESVITAGNSKNEMD